MRISDWSSDVCSSDLAEVLSNRLFATLSLYNIKVSDRVYPDPVNINNSVQGGAVRSQGFEVDIQAHPVEGLNVLAGYSYNQIETVEGNFNVNNLTDEVYYTGYWSVNPQRPRNFVGGRSEEQTSEHQSLM